MSTQPSPRQTARVAGLLYLAVALLGGWAHLGARALVHDPGDAAATASAIAQHATTLRLAVGADVLQATAFAIFGLAMQRLLQHVHARAAAALVLGTWLSAGMVLVALTFHVGALLVVTEPAVASSLSNPDGLALLLLDLQSVAYTLAGPFFALWLGAAAFLAGRSELFPRVARPILAAGAVTWLLDPLLVLVVPDVPGVVHDIALAPAWVAEIGLLLYLLVVGVRVREPRPLSPAAAAV